MRFTILLQSAAPLVTSYRAQLYRTPVRSGTPSPTPYATAPYCSGSIYVLFPNGIHARKQGIQIVQCLSGCALYFTPSVQLTEFPLPRHRIETEGEHDDLGGHHAEKELAEII